MAKIFEDELMDLQADYVSLCMEVMEGIADEIFIYISNEEDVAMFHTFCRVKGQVKTLGQLCPIPLQRELLMVGSGDIKKINEICKRYDMPAPTEIRLHYWVKSNSLDAHFKYDPVCSGDCGFGPVDVFDAWVEEERKKDIPQKSEKKSPWAFWKK